ncbi:hypothetical protein CRG98_016074 [Punica granatum]|uniref:Uncharacterized protein n=1 Tax=Punica granatum TaxID=22663 RepID=A0A2I0K786_PUNGR|nr:hypothetical protein CRG98_016074 [Punica granatum]
MSPTESPSCTNPNVDSRRGPHARDRIARLGSIHFSVGTRDGHKRETSQCGPPRSVAGVDSLDHLGLCENPKKAKEPVDLPGSDLEDLLYPNLSYLKSVENVISCFGIRGKSRGRAGESGDSVVYEEKCFGALGGRSDELGRGTGVCGHAQGREEARGGARERAQQAGARQRAHDTIHPRAHK